MIHYFPLEILETRYTKHLDTSIVEYLEASGKSYIRYYSDMDGRETAPPAPGKFLNAPTSIEFKANQVARFARNVSDGLVKPHDLVFFSDLWHPGVIDLAYLNFFEDLRLDIRGLLWAGSFTDADLIRGAERWAGPLENVIFDIVDRVFVTSAFMYHDVMKKRAIDPVSVEVSYCPLDPHLPEPKEERERLVVFNGRDSAEKQPHLFDALTEELALHPGGFTAVNAIKGNYLKADYYDLLSRATVCVSFALEETFGFGLLEAAVLGCVPVVPDRLCYPEFFPKAYRYSDFDGAVRLVRDALAGDLKPIAPGYMTSLREAFDRAPELWFAQ